MSVLLKKHSGYESIMENILKFKECNLYNGNCIFFFSQKNLSLIYQSQSLLLIKTGLVIL